MKKITTRRILLGLLILFGAAALDLIAFKLGIQTAIIHAMLGRTSDNPDYVQQTVHVNRVASHRNLESCPTNSMAKRRTTKSDGEINFVEQEMPSNATAWLQTVANVEDSNLDSEIIKTNRARYYFHADFNNDNKTDVLVFQKLDHKVFQHSLRESPEVTNSP